MDKLQPPNPSTQNAQKTYKRRVRNIFIHKPMQREFTFVMIALLMVSTLAIGFVIHETIRQAAFGGGFHFGRINPYEVLSQVSYELIFRISSILFVTLIIIGIFGVFFLHRVAGPVYRFRQVLLRVNEGELPPPIQLREGDFFSEIAAEMNELLEKLQLENKRSELVKEKIDKLLNSGVPDNISKSLQEIKLTLDRPVK